MSSAQPGPMTQDQLRLSRGRRTWRWKLATAILILMGGAVAIGVYLSFAPERELRDLLAETDQLDAGWRLDELESRRAVLLDAENSALQVVLAKQLIPVDWPNPLLDSDLTKLSPGERLTEEQVQDIRAELQKASQALETTRKLLTMPLGRFPISWRTDYYSTTILAQDARPLSTLLRFDAMLRAHEGDVDGAMDSCRTMINVSRSIGDEPRMISQLARLDLRRMAVRQLEWVLSRGQPSDQSLAAMQRVLEEELEPDLLLIGMRGERAGMDRFMEAVQNGEASYMALLGQTFSGSASADAIWDRARAGSPARNRAALLKYMNEVVEIAKLSIPEQRQRLQNAEVGTEDEPFAVQTLAPSLLRIGRAYHKEQAELRCAIAAVAVERYRHMHGHWPATLQMLVPDLVENLPIDPYTDQPLQLRRLADGVLIYSVGHDGKDDGGSLNRDKPWEAGTDVGFRLWDVPHRRDPRK